MCVCVCVCHFHHHRWFHWTTLNSGMVASYAALGPEVKAFLVLSRPTWSYVPFENCLSSSSSRKLIPTTLAHNRKSLLWTPRAHKICDDSHIYWCYRFGFKLVSFQQHFSALKSRDWILLPAESQWEAESLFLCQMPIRNIYQTLLFSSCRCVCSSLLFIYKNLKVFIRIGV